MDIKRYVGIEKKLDWTDENRLRDPMIWFSKASSYSSAVLYLQENFSRIKTGSEISHLFNAIKTVPYLTGLAAELYMKGYLVFKGTEPHDVKKIGHNLSDLRIKCLEHGDQRFKNESLMFLTDVLGVHIIEGGGIRYPDKKEIPIYLTHFQEGLGVLMEIVREIKIPVKITRF